MEAIGRTMNEYISEACLRFDVVRKLAKIICKASDAIGPYRFFWGIIRQLCKLFKDSLSFFVGLGGCQTPRELFEFGLTQAGQDARNAFANLDGNVIARPHDQVAAGAAYIRRNKR